jgi:hypothetical protein
MQGLAPFLFLQVTENREPDDKQDDEDDERCESIAMGLDAICQRDDFKHRPQSRAAGRR